MVYKKHKSCIADDTEFIIFYNDQDKIEKIYCPDNDLLIYCHANGSIWLNDRIYQEDLDDRKEYAGDYPAFEELRKYLGI